MKVRNLIQRLHRDWVVTPTTSLHQSSATLHRGPPRDTMNTCQDKLAADDEETRETLEVLDRCGDPPEFITLGGKMLSTRTEEIYTTRNTIDLSPLRFCRDLKGLDIVSTRVTDLSPLAGLTNLECLDLSSTRVTDLSPLAGLNNLAVLCLRDSQITDLTPLAGLNNLEFLQLNRSPITDLTPLAKLTHLEELDLSETPSISASQIERLREQLPNCNITG